MQSSPREPDGGGGCIAKPRCLACLDSVLAAFVKPPVGDTWQMPHSLMAALVALVSGTRTTVVSGAESATELYAATLLAEVREEVDRADGKAQTGLAAAGVAIGALLAGLTAGRWSPLKLSTSVQWLWWVGVAAAACGLWCLASAVYPRERSRESGNSGIVAYFGDAVRFESATQLAEALSLSATAGLVRLADQIRRVSMIVDRKYRLVCAGMWLMFAAAACCSASLIVDILLR